jgi:hypothetical protein
MGKVDFGSIFVTIGFLIISIALYYKFWYLSTDTDNIIRFLTIFVFAGTAILVLGCAAKYFGYTNTDIEALR